MAELKEMAFQSKNWTKIMLGEYDHEQYMHERIQLYPEAARELEIILSPKLHRINLPLVQENVELVRQLHEEGEYKMYWLSNMDGAEYDYLAEEGIVEMLDGGCYSCVEHSKKPTPEFYERLFERYQLDPEECWFFDDRERNIVAGEKLGMRGTVVPELGKLREVLDEVLREIEAR